MKRLLFLISLPMALSVNGQHQTDTFSFPHIDGILPYTVEINEVSLDPAPLPNIHSIAAAEWDGQWVFMAGRTNGLHGLTGMNAFDPAFENRKIWVVDPRGKESWSKSIETSAASGLTQDVVDSLSSVNTQFYQDGPHWLIVGGYGFKRSAGDHVTYDTLTALDLPGLVDWVKAAPGEETTLTADHIEQIRSSFFQVTGGGLERIGDEYQLIFVQNYEGRYRPMLDGVYTKQIRRFQVDFIDGLSAPVGSRIRTAPQDAFRRRDLNVLTILERSGIGSFEERAVALSGVFTLDTGVWTAPVIVGPEGSFVMDDPEAENSLKQGFQVYHCSKASLFNRVTDEAHMLLFGGLTVLERDLDSGAYTQDDQVPFTNQCSVVVRDAGGRFQQYWLPTRFPEILLDGKELRFGTNAEFFISNEAPKLHPKVIDLARIDEPTVIGHILGGLVADAGNNGNTGSTGRVFEVTLIPGPPEGLAALAISRNPQWKLNWEPVPNRANLIETSTDLENWDEESAPLTSSYVLPIEPVDEPRFNRRRLSEISLPD